MNNYISTAPLFNSSDYLAHHGIKGQKWGIRRYQNEDGTLTEEGRRRYGYNLDLSDTSKINIAKIRSGEARRRFEYSKEYDKSNKKNLRKKYYAAKKSEQNVKRVEKGRALYAKGNNIFTNRIQRYLVSGAAAFSANGFKRLMYNATSSMNDRGVLTLGKYNTMSLLAAVGSTAIGMAGSAYAIKKISDNTALRAYYASTQSSAYNNKKIGGKEYADRIKGSKK